MRFQNFEKLRFWQTLIYVYCCNSLNIFFSVTKKNRSVIDVWSQIKSQNYNVKNLGTNKVSYLLSCNFWWLCTWASSINPQTSSHQSRDVTCRQGVIFPGGVGGIPPGMVWISQEILTKTFIKKANPITKNKWKSNMECVFKHSIQLHAVL